MNLAFVKTEGFAMRLICAVLGCMSLCAADAAAQTKELHDLGMRKIKVIDGEKVTVAGCIARNPGGGYMLTNDAGGLRYDLVTNKDLSSRLGNRVEVRGKATDLGPAKMTIESKVGDYAAAKTEMTGNLGLKYLGVDKVETISADCQATATVAQR